MTKEDVKTFMPAGVTMLDLVLTNKVFLRDGKDIEVDPLLLKEEDIDSPAALLEFLRANFKGKPTISLQRAEYQVFPFKGVSVKTLYFKLAQEPIFYRLHSTYS